MHKNFYWIFVFIFWVPQISFGNSSKAGGFVSAEALYWRAYEQGLGYTNKPANVLETDDFTRNRLFKPSFDWEWGFRIGAGYIQEKRNWSYQAFWTNLKSKAHGQKSFNSGSPDFEGIFPVWSMGPDTLEGDYVSSASSTWHLTLNLFDLNAQYTFCLGKCRWIPCKPISPLQRKRIFANRKKKNQRCEDAQEETANRGPWFNQVDLTPFFGARMAILDQKLSARYEGGAFFSGVDLNTLQCDFWGGGPRVGLNANYFMVYGISLFARAAVAPLFGRFDRSQREVYLESARFDRSNRYHHFLLSADAEAGFRWRGAVIDDWMFAIFGAAWEGQAFMRANRFYRGPFGFFHKNRNLFLQGVTFSAALEF